MPAFQSVAVLPAGGEENQERSFSLESSDKGAAKRSPLTGILNILLREGWLAMSSKMEIFPLCVGKKY